MKKMIQKASIVLFALITLGANAQDQGNALDSTAEKKNAVAAYFGLPGFGIGYARKFTDHASLRVAGTFMGASVKREGVEISDRKVDFETKFNFNKIDVLFDYTPFKESSFKLVAGFAYLYNGKFTADVIPAEDAIVLGVVIPKEDLGTVKAGADWSGIAPYIATGFGRAVPKNNVGFGFELGGYFIGKPEATYVSTGATKTVEEEEKKDFEDMVSKFKFMPSLMFHFTVKL